MAERLDIYEEYPRDMRVYLKNYGWHFSKRAFEWACSMMRKENPATKKQEKVDPWTKEQVDDLLKKNGIDLKNKIGYDYVYVANMAKTDYLNSSLANDAAVAKFVRDFIDDTDGYDSKAFTHFVADCIGKGCPIEWSDLL